MKKGKIAVFPGSFDPITKGHVDLIERACGLFDEVIVALGYNMQKSGMFSLEQRLEWMRIALQAYPQVTLQSYQGLTMDFCQSVQADFIVRGLRNSIDLEFEKPIAQANATLGGIESYFLVCKPEFSGISSSIIRDVFKNGGDPSPFLPEGVQLSLDK